MDPTLKASIDSAAHILTNIITKKNRGGPDSIVAAANAVDGIRKAVIDTQTYAASVTFVPKTPDPKIVELLSTTRVNKNNTTNENTNTNPVSSSNASTEPEIDIAATLVINDIFEYITLHYDRKANQFLQSIHNNNKIK